MAWYGPSGNCGCCAGDCSCQLPCQCSDGSYYESYTTTIENFPASYVHTTYGPLNQARRYTFYGLQNINGSYTYPFIADDLLGCAATGAIFAINPIVYSGALTYELGTYTGTDFCNASFTSSETYAAEIELQIFTARWSFRFAAIDSPLGLAMFFEGGADHSLGSATCGQPKFDCNIGPLATGSNNLRDWDPYPSGGYNICPAGDAIVNTSYCVNYTNIGQQSITGWQYTYSDLPATFDVRVGATETVYRCSGVDALNGVYEVARREDMDCATGSSSVEVPITADRYTISTSAPCLETPDPGGSGLTGTATLRVPPLSGRAVLIINIDGESFSKSYDVSESWNPHTCDTVTEEFNESDPCLANPSPWLTIEGVPVF